MQSLKKLIGAVLVATLLISSTPTPAYAMIGCDSDQHVAINAPEYNRPADTEWGAELGHFEGTAHKTKSTLFYDEFTFTAVDAMSGATITGTYRVSTFNCLLQQSGITGGTAPGYDVHITSYTPVQQ